MTTSAGSIGRRTQGGKTLPKASATGSRGVRDVGSNVLTGRGVLQIPNRREPRKRPSDAPKQPRIPIGMEVVIEVPCEFSGCGRGFSLRHGLSSRYHGVVEQKRGKQYLVVSRLYGSFWVLREHMFSRDHNGRTFTTPLLVKDDRV